MKKFSLFEKIILALALIFALSIGAYDYFGRRSAAKNLSGEPYIVVSVLGEVRRPGTVEVESGARVDDAIRAAGGPTELADLDGVNLAHRLNDEEEIIVPKLKRPPEQGGDSSDSQNDVDGVIININTASPDDLMKIPGIGKVKAGDIIAYRSRYGDFKSVDELLLVKGIGEKTLEKIRQYITV